MKAFWLLLLRFSLLLLTPSLLSLLPKSSSCLMTGVSKLNSAERKYLDKFFERQTSFQTISFLVLFLNIFLFSSVHAPTCKAWDIGYFSGLIKGRWQSCCVFKGCCALNRFIRTRLAWYAHNCLPITITTYFKYLEMLFSTLSADRSCKVLETRPKKRYLLLSANEWELL